MCYHQNVHTAFHYELLSLDAREREGHACQFRWPGTNGGKSGLKGVGEKCLLHSCCWVSRVVVLSCCQAGFGEYDGGGGGGNEVCSRLFVEDVFVPLPDGGGRKEKEKGVLDPVDACPNPTGAGTRAAVARPMVKFWPRDGHRSGVLMLPGEMAKNEEKKAEKEQKKQAKKDETERKRSIKVRKQNDRIDAMNSH
ncbi:hypothetical protein F5B21DRAFT_519897 [Xylaria acuta]|nr:hypothetical protein F5B21DRAFT_519897 [Xylaria acuta]